ncbi:MAG: CDP-diacylglycerol--glycerol-3-phosphate 3-phosphatidyltransferase [Acidobacteria bacterium]|nr:CDP-diacylglycerol--glycerol-3-phosphate 3-phosphatidyltransferase [Acidobacteriota bacterium]
MNLPNTLTLMRIFLVPVIVAALVQPKVQLEPIGINVPNDLLALITFLAAALTDLLDGYLARRWQQITTVGTLLDPIADKLLISSALISLVQVNAVPAWMVVLVVGREFAVTGLRSIAAAHGYVIKASDLAKTKLVTQVIATALLMLSIRWKELHTLAMVWMWCVVFFSMASAALYFRKFWRKVDVQVKKRRRRELLRLERQKLKIAKRNVTGA